MFSFAAFFTARTTLCVIRYDHLAMKLGPDVQEWKFNRRLWTSISDARICKRCSVNQTSFHIPTVYSHFSLIFPHFLACSVRCGAFIQCGGDSVTDLQTVGVRYRARANGIGPEPDSVLRLVRSLTLNDLKGHFFSCNLVHILAQMYYQGIGYHMWAWLSF